LVSAFSLHSAWMDEVVILIIEAVLSNFLIENSKTA